MIKHTVLAILLILSLQQANATTANFQTGSVQTTVTACVNKNTIITFKELNKDYQIYDKNSASVKLLRCEKIKIKNLNFYSVLFSSEVQEGPEIQKALTYEVVLVDKNKLKTVRSETVDQLDLTGDSASTTFENTVKTAWAYDSKKDTAMLKIDIQSKNEKSEPYSLIYNKKNQWFENIFEKPKKNIKKTK